MEVVTDGNNTLSAQENWTKIISHLAAIKIRLDYNRQQQLHVEELEEQLSQEYLHPLPCELVASKEALKYYASHPEYVQSHKHNKLSNTLMRLPVGTPK